MLTEYIQTHTNAHVLHYLLASFSAKIINIRTTNWREDVYEQRFACQ